MKITFVASLVAGKPLTTLTDQEAVWLTQRAASRREQPPATDRSFVYLKGPNVVAAADSTGRYFVAIAGHYGLPIPTTSPVDWIAQAFAERSTGCFADINGSWRLLIVDRERGTAFVATDRMGSHRVCFSVGPGPRLTIGHDSEAVARIRNSSVTIDPNGLFQYFYFHFVPSPNTLFEEVRCLGPAEYFAWNDDGGQRRRYWNPQFAGGDGSRRRVSPSDLLDVLDTSVRSSCSAPTATFLSGGLDSSTVLGLACKHLPGAVRPFTIGFDEPTYDETRYAKIAADRFGVKLKRYEVKPADVVDAISRVAESYDEPFGNSSAIPTYFCAKAAADSGETSILAGDGGDELFAGNERYRTQEIFSRYLSLPHALREHVIEPAFLRLFASTSFYPIRKARRYVEQAKLPMPDRLQTYNFLHVHGLERIFTPRLLAAVEATRPLQHLRDVYAESETDCLVDKMLYLDWKLTLADNDLRKVTTMCEAAGIEVKFPMLDNALIDISCEIPGDVKLRGGNLRDFFKKAVRPLLPQAILDKSKHGFGLPFGPWFAKSPPLRSYMGGLLDSLGTRGIVRTDYIDLVRKATLEEHAGFYGEIVWLMCVLESWLSARPEWRSYRL